MMLYTGGAVASVYPVITMSVICIVNGTRSQNPAPNHCAASTGEAPIATHARNTVATAITARENASGNQVSNQSDSRSPAVTSAGGGELVEMSVTSETIAPP